MNYSPTLPQMDSISAHDSFRRSVGRHSVDSVDASLSSGDSRLLAQTKITAGELLRIHEYERQRMGQELHDSTGQLVVALLLSLARLRRTEEGCGQGSVIDEIQELVRRIDREIRSLAFLHYPAELGDHCLAASIERLALGLGSRSGMQIYFQSTGETPPMDDTVSIALLRVTQEALVNVHRHSRAKSAKVELESRPGELELRISDDGIGMPAVGEGTKERGIGLRGMRYRVEACGGCFKIRNLRPGLMVRAIVPLAA